MPKKKTALITAAFFAIILIAVIAVWVLQREEPLASSVFAMGSYVQQTVYGQNREDAVAKANSAIWGLENRISWRREGSCVHLLNSSAGQTVPLDGDTRSILETALAVSKESAGAFDVTIAPLSWLWDFDTDPHRPAAAEIAESLPLIDYKKLSLSPGGASLPQGMAVDLGAAGKGAACDAAVEAYRQAGLQGAVVAVGGSVGLYGEKPGGGPWRVSVRDPWGEGSIGSLALEGGFVSTSGSYEKCFEQDGVSYHHLLDPKTGYPADSGLASVTVVSSSGTLSDCLATACFVLGYEESLPLLEHFQAQALFIDTEKQARLTPGLQDAFTPWQDGNSLA